VRDDVVEFLEFVVGGTPSRFMMHAADWERLYRFVEYVARIDAGARPSEEEVAAHVRQALPRREDWADEIVLAYRHTLGLLDHRAASGR
jgi:hypothetical protein